MTKDEIDNHVGKRLKARRTMLGLSQEALAKAVGITFQQVQKYEKGSNAMNANRLVEFARCMHVPVSYFFDELERSTTTANAAGGFAETPAMAFDHAPAAGATPVSDRETLEVMKAFNRITDPNVRKRIADLVRAIADNKPVLD
jgi:transcriptional regulator with XRE-family HTH domain